MFEAQTYEVIMNRMLGRIPSTFDKREGSVIWDSLSPTAIELTSLYIAFDSMLKETFGDTASRDYLIRLCAERGLTPYPASKSLVKITTTPSSLDVPIGQRFNSNIANYVITQKISNGVYKAQCEEAGIIGNQYLGSLLPITYLSGLESATLSEILIYGEDPEDTEALRERYFESFNEKAFSGNKQDYHNKTLAISGVGAVKIEPVWNGAGTVRLTILDSQYGIASNELITLVKNTFDPNSDGKGDGVAPIGHVVTVRTPTAVSINVLATITFESGYVWDSDMQTKLENAVKGYLATLNSTWEDADGLTVRISGIESAILAVPEVVDIENTKINGSATNLVLTVAQLPVFGSIGANT